MTELPTRMSERFTLAEVIGRGTCSTVFRARDELLDRDVAVKIFPVADDPRVEREVRLLASLDHPALVPVYDVGEVDGRAFVVMALFEGGNLADRLAAGGPLPLSEALLAAAAVADALAHVHRAGVLHRDVIPRNMLFDTDGRAHLSDFGVAFVADAPRITDTGIVVGSAPYLAPEQVRGEDVGQTADVYALGLVLIEALSGRRAYEGAPLEAAQARLEHPPVIPRGLPADVSELIGRMTADDPVDRPDAETVCRRLRRAALADELGPGDPRADLLTGGFVTDLTAPTPGPGFRGSRGARRERSAMVLGAATLSLLLASGVVIASAGPVVSVSATTPPEAGLAAPTVAAAPPAFAVPVVGGTDDWSEFDGSAGYSEPRSAESSGPVRRVGGASVVADSSPDRAAGEAPVRLAEPRATTRAAAAPVETDEATTTSPTTTTTTPPSPRSSTTTTRSTTTTTAERQDDEDEPRSVAPRAVAPSSTTTSSPTTRSAAPRSTTTRSAAPRSTTTRSAAPRSTTTRSVAPRSTPTTSTSDEEAATDEDGTEPENGPSERRRGLLDALARPDGSALGG